jgi:hypothetical protein
LVRDGFGEEGLACAGYAVEDDALRWFDAHFFVELRVC